jgi:hypothetical protein
MPQAKARHRRFWWGSPLGLTKVFHLVGYRRRFANVLGCFKRRVFRQILRISRLQQREKTQITHIPAKSLLNIARTVANRGAMSRGKLVDVVSHLVLRSIKLPQHFMAALELRCQRCNSFVKHFVPNRLMFQHIERDFARPRLILFENLDVLSREVRVKDVQVCFSV